MSKYLVLIDETGNFTYSELGKSFVGGVIFRDLSVDDLRDILALEIKKFNETLSQSCSGAYQLDVNNPTRDLHANVLCYGDWDAQCGRRVNRKGFLEGTGEGFISNVLGAMSKHAHLAFKSAGINPLYLGPQHVYYLHVSTALFGILKDVMPIKKTDTIEFAIGYRNLKKILGEALTTAEERRIQQNYCRDLKRDLLSNYGAKIPECNLIIRLLDAHDPNIAWPDFFLWEVTHAERMGGGKISGYREYDVSNLSYYSGVDFQNWIEKYEKDFGLVKCILRLTLLAATENSKEAFDKLGIKCKNMQRRDIAELAKDLWAYISGLLDGKGCQLELDKLLAFLRISAPFKNDERIRNIVMQTSVRLKAHGYHAGGISFDLDSYNSFMDKKGSTLYNNVLERYSSTLESDLYLIQEPCFNNMEFQNVPAFMAARVKKYKKTLINLKDFHSDSDDLLARLLGTCAQAYGFLASLPTTPEKLRKQYYLKAEKMLKEDIKMLGVGAKYYSQGCNYLCSLYWDMGACDKALKVLFPEKDSHSPKHLLEKSSKWSDPYALLNRLRLLAHYRTEVSRAEFESICVEMHDALASQDRDDYPSTLIVKWTAYFMHLVGDSSKACALLRKYTFRPRGIPVLEIMRANEILLSGIVGGVGIEEAKAIISSYRESPKIKQVLVSYDWSRYLLGKNKDVPTIESVVKGLPYYFS